MTPLTWAAENLQVPFGISIFLYVWIAAGYWAMGSWKMSIAWVCYAVANAAFMADALERARKLKGLG